MIQVFHPPTSPGGRLLQAKLSEVIGPSQIGPLRVLHVYWGQTTQSGTGPNFRCLNGTSPRLNSLEQLGHLAAAGVPTIDHTADLQVARRWVQEGELVFGRSLLHTHGNDIVGPRHPVWSRKEWWSKVIRNSTLQEWRLHVVCGRVIARGLKHLPDEGEVWRRLPVRSRNNGWRLRHDVDPPELLRVDAKRAVAACRYDFGAVDMLYVPDPPQCWVLEINRMPGLDDYTATAYARAFVREWQRMDQVQVQGQIH